MVLEQFIGWAHGFVGWVFMWLVSWSVGRLVGWSVGCSWNGIHHKTSMQGGAAKYGYVSYYNYYWGSDREERGVSWATFWFLFCAFYVFLFFLAARRILFGAGERRAGWPRSSYDLNSEKMWVCEKPAQVSKAFLCSLRMGWSIAMPRSAHAVGSQIFVFSVPVWPYICK